MYYGLSSHPYQVAMANQTPGQEPEIPSVIVLCGFHVVLNGFAKQRQGTGGRNVALRGTSSTLSVSHSRDAIPSTAQTDVFLSQKG